MWDCRRQRPCRRKFVATGGASLLMVNAAFAALAAARIMDLFPGFVTPI